MPNIDVSLTGKIELEVSISSSTYDYLSSNLSGAKRGGALIGQSDESSFYHGDSCFVAKLSNQQ